MNFVFFMWTFFFSSRRRHTRSKRDWSSDVCSSDLATSTVPAMVLLDGRPCGKAGAMFRPSWKGFILLLPWLLHNLCLIVSVGRGVSPLGVNLKKKYLNNRKNEGGRVRSATVEACTNHALTGGTTSCLNEISITQMIHSRKQHPVPRSAGTNWSNSGCLPTWKARLESWEPFNECAN